MPDKTRRDALRTVEDEAKEIIAQSRPSQAKRNRSWERKNPAVAYRGIPPKVQERILTIAKEHSVPVGELAGRLLEAGLTLFDRGELPLTPQLKAGKYTLYPVPGNGK